MAAITSSDVTVTIRHRERLGKKTRVMATVTFGNGVLTYPTGGVPLPAKSYFRLSSVDAFHIEAPSGNGYVYKYDAANHKIKMFQTATLTPAGTVAAPTFTGAGLATHTHDLSFIGGITATEPVAIDGGDTLGKNAATNRTIAGADVGTKGGVIAVSGGTPAGTCSAPAFTGAATTAAALAEVGAAVTPAAATLYVDAWGKM